MWEQQEGGAEGDLEAWKLTVFIGFVGLKPE